MGRIGLPELIVIGAVLLIAFVVSGAAKGLGLTQFRGLQKVDAIVTTTIGLALSVWTYTRMTSLAGQFHSWSPPFTEYETTTLAGGGIGALFLVWGLSRLLGQSSHDGGGAVGVPASVATRTAEWRPPVPGAGAAPSGAKFCANCGIALVPASRFCGGCGSAVQSVGT